MLRWEALVRWARCTNRGRLGCLRNCSARARTERGLSFSFARFSATEVRSVIGLCLVIDHCHGICLVCISCRIHCACTYHRLYYRHLSTQSILIHPIAYIISLYLPHFCIILSTSTSMLSTRTDFITTATQSKKQQGGNSSDSGEIIIYNIDGINKIRRGAHHSAHS